MSVSRRQFLTAAALSSFALSLEAQENKPSGPVKMARKPVLICAANGYNYIDRGYGILSGGGDPLEAGLSVVRGPEDDPNDHSVGLGGLPNEEGVVELDSCCMHGPSQRAGSVGGVHDIKNVSLLARAVMEHTGHVMLVGDNATKFGLEIGFPRENLLTDDSRKMWILWKESHSDQDWWGPGPDDPRWHVPTEEQPVPTAEYWQRRSRTMEALAERLGIPPELRQQAIRNVFYPPTGTIHCSVLSAKGEMAGTTTTSGLAWKVPGRVGDSPIIGAGCYTDQEVGSAGATGSGEENIKVCGAKSIIENMRHGMSPEEAGMDVLRRIAHNYKNDMTRLRYIDMTYYILRKDGAYAGVSLWTGYSQGSPHKYAIHDGTRRLEQTAALFEGYSREWPPMPKGTAY
ncbi:MAG TPA: N(4)-(beta-N-acetylglucosaminyl)-L-asparaginase [Terriglobales bacterium]|nr:N(4)-(beta-N-acetylglucosaminyl)-L-asparaginase [Terriglobales bacterium]